MRTPLALVLAVAAWSAAMATPPATSTAKQAREDRISEGKALTAARCTGCHGLSRVTTAGRSEEAWRVTVDDMIRLGAEATPDEAGAIVAYLALNFPGRP